MADGLKVLMMGGKRVGKSSALAAVMDAFINGESANYFNAKDTTVLSKIDGEKQASIKSKLSDVKEMLSKYSGKTILVDSGSTSKKWDYTLELTLPNTNDSMEITFTDINGEFFEGGNLYQEEVIGLVKEYDVFIVAVDTTFLMEARNSDSDLVNEVINIKYNCVESIHTFLSYINDDDGANAKLVIFVPIKCERWAKEGKLETVSSALQEDYKTAISALEKYKSVQIEILPIQTVGSALFSKHMEAYVFDWTSKFLFFFNQNKSSKCGLLPNNEVLLSDGTTKQVECGNLREDMDAILIPNTDILRPNSWYEITSSEYAPHNCEQLAYHILEFMLAKVIDAKIRRDENTNVFVRLVRNVWNRLRDIFGGINIEQMKSVISQLKSHNLIKESGEGIVILKKCNFRM